MNFYYLLITNDKVERWSLQDFAKSGLSINEEIASDLEGSKNWEYICNMFMR